MLNIIAHPVVQRKNCKFTQGFTAIILCKMQHPRCGLPYILWGLQPGCRLHRVSPPLSCAKCNTRVVVCHISCGGCSPGAGYTGFYGAFLSCCFRVL